METKRKIKIINQMKCWFFKKTSKVEKPLEKLSKSRRVDAN
jgi:hypothetical protein